MSSNLKKKQLILNKKTCHRKYKDSSLENEMKREKVTLMIKNGIFPIVSYG